MLSRSKFARSKFARVAFYSISAALAVVLSFELWFVPPFVNPAFAQSKTENKTQGDPGQRQPEKVGTSATVARGKYLVEGVAMCGTCHTPTDGSGNPDRARWLQGAPVPYMPARPSADWPISAPRIGGTPPADDADMIKLLTTGIWTTGNHLRLPMPQFRMDRSDAEAIVAYLKTVKTQQ